MGINTRNIKLLAFAMGASFGGVAGGPVCRFPGLCQPGELQPDGIGDGAVHGGAGRHGHIPGVILGAVLLTLTPEVLRDVMVPLQRNLWGKCMVDPETLRMLLFGLALILVMLLRPEGIVAVVAPQAGAARSGG
jgi:branched-chain amino acid transport system permease protein